MKKTAKSHKLRVIYAVILIVIFVVGIGIIVVKSPLYKGSAFESNKIAVIPIKGAIASQNGNGDFLRGGTTGSASIVGFIEQASRDDSI